MREKKDKKRFLRSPLLRTEPSNVEKHIKLGDLRDLIFWCSDVPAIAHAPKWVAIENKNGIDHIISLFVPGLPVDQLCSSLDSPQPQPVNEGVMDSLKFFEYAWPTKLSGKKEQVDKPEWAFSRAALSKAESKARIKARKEKLEAQTNDAPLSSKDLVIPMDQLDSTRYKLVAPSDEWITIATEPSSEVGRVFAIDCEMCVTASGTALTRVSIIDENLECIYNSFVQPEEKIIDYVTQFSGITPELLDGVTTTLKDVQQWLKDNLKKNDVLVGHSLECDLDALKLVHLNIIDTGVLFPHPRGSRFRHALKWLAKKFLDSEIQNGVDGHDPTEDATACMKLIHLKLEKGLDFGLPIPTTSLTERLKSSGKSTCIIDYGVPQWDPMQLAQSVISVSTDDEVVSHIAQQSAKHDFTWASLKELAHARAKNDENIYSQVIEATNDRIQQIIGAVPGRSMVILWSGMGDSQDWFKLTERKKKWLDDYANKMPEEIENHWTNTDAEELLKAAEMAKSGLSFIQVKEGDLSAKRVKVE